MNRMNFSRFIYFKELSEELLKLDKRILKGKAPEIIKELDFQAERIFRRQKGGFWDITDGDKVFIGFLKELARSLQSGNPCNSVEELLRKAESLREERLKIVFLAQESVCWPSLESFYHSCVKDERFNTDLVYVPFEHANSNSDVDYFKAYTEELKLPIIRHNEYSVSEESPDLAVFVKPYDCIPIQYHIDAIHKVVERSVYIRYGFEIADYNVDLHFKLPLEHKAWRFIAYGKLVKELAAKHGYRNGENVAVWGHPRADMYRDLPEKKKTLPKELTEKIKNRKTVLWNTQHTIMPGFGAGTYFQWKDEIFKYFKDNQDMFLLWRPHPLMFGAIVNNGFMTREELDAFVRELSAEDNILVDQSTDYRNAFYASDAIVTDGTAFFLEYLYTGNPLLYTPKKGGGSIYNAEEIMKGLYVAREPNDVKNFLDMVREGRDPMKDERDKLKNELLYVPENKSVGQNIVDNIAKELTEEEKRKATSFFEGLR